MNIDIQRYITKCEFLKAGIKIHTKTIERTQDALQSMQCSLVALKTTKQQILKKAALEEKLLIEQMEAVDN